ncbi:NTP transferase domain-containing protein [Akkermansiaceae bacterium]|nr:NTP transferase domain-containing protein [Akkermansiaceae bacterium]
MKKLHLKALILAGGKSSRMGEDKASLKIGGVSLLDRMTELLSEFTSDLYLSVAHGCQDSASGIQQLPDLEPSPGPLGGLQAAFDNDPEAHWLLIAIDLPRITRDDLALLLSSHNPEKDVTCFLNPLDDHPEPLCALYSSSASPKLTQVILENRRCARRFLRSLTRTELVASDPQALLNLNRPEHLTELEHLYQHGIVEKELTIEYFAKLSQEAGTNSEKIRTSTATLTGLWEEVRLRHHFSLDLPQIKPAIHDAFTDWDTPIKEGDRVAFMPPFAGG